jgi:lysophospholipase L1-like esterase
MKHVRGIQAFVAIASLVAFACGLAPISHADSPAKATPTAPAKKRIYVVAAMGDSLTDPKSHGGKYLEALQTRCPKSRFDSYGVGGNMVNQMRKRFERDVFGEGTGETRPAYTHVIVLGGIGDILSNETAKRSASLIAGDLTTMYEMARAHHAEVIALTLPPWGGFKAYDTARHVMTLKVNTFIQEKATDGVVDFAVDIYPLLSCGDKRKLCPDYAWNDHLHWSEKGHDVVAKALYSQVFSDCE